MEVEVAYTAKEKKTLKEQRKKDSKARFLLYQGLDESTFERVAKATTSKEAWEILATIYKGVERVKRLRIQSLRGDLEDAQMKISDYYSRLLLIVNKMRRNREKMEDIRVIEKLLRSLTSQFEHIVAVIEESKNLKEISIEELLGSLQVHEQRMQKKIGSIVLKQALDSKLTLNDRGSHSRGRGRGRDRGRGPQRRTTQNQVQFQRFRGRG